MTKVTSNLTEGTTTSGPAKAKRPRRKAEYVLLEMGSDDSEFKVVIRGGKDQGDILKKAVEADMQGTFQVAAFYRCKRIGPKRVDPKLIVEDVAECIPVIGDPLKFAT